MTNKTAAQRYARALFDVVRAEKADIDQVESDLAGFVDLCRKNPSLERVLLNPAVPTPRKRAAVQELATRAHITPIVTRLLLLLAERDRFPILYELLAAFRERLLDHRQVVRAEVRSSVPLDAARVQAIEASFARVTGRSVMLTARVDEALIGGMVARVGSTVYDASVARQLQRIKKNLEQGSGRRG